MRKPRRADRAARPAADPAGSGGGWGPSPGFLAAALGLVVGGFAMGWTMSATPPDAEPPAAARASASVAGASATVPAVAVPVVAAPPAAVVAPAAPAASAAKARIWRTREPDSDTTPDLADYVNEGERPTMAQVIDRLHLAGITSGLGAFSPPGTRPPLVGLAVPEDFPLPEGYVRHHQATDDGQRIEAILMFAPGHAVVDAAGRRIAVPPDRVVPPELAPPGLPIRRIVVPAPADGTRS